MLINRGSNCHCRVFVSLLTPWWFPPAILLPGPYNCQSVGEKAGAEATDTEASAEVDSDAASEAETRADADADHATDGEPAVPSARVFASPSTRTLARELGVDISAVDGSGPGGRVTGADVRAASRNGTVARMADDAAGAEQSAEAASGDLADPSRTEDSAAVVASTSTAAATDAAVRDRTLAMPATRRLADELGVDLDAVPASEKREGEPYVTPEDVQAYAEGGATAAPTSAATGDAAQAASASEAAAGAAGTASDAGEETSATGDAGSVPGDRVPYRGVRRTIGEQMAESKYTAPHVSHHDEFDASALVELREDLAAAAEADGVKLTYLPFVVKALTTALQEFPYLNASLDEENEEIVLHDEYNIGIAVATDAGLMVPVVDDADEKGLKRLATEIRDIAGRARDRKIKPEEMQGGTFTITNIGVIGGEFSSPIINYPEAAIFAMGPIKKRPWVVDDEVVARETMRFSMSVDHRLVDGADAARFSNRVKELLAEPTRLLLE